MLDPDPVTRRQACRLAAATTLGLAGTLGAGPEDRAATIAVAEKAGIRRYGYPVHARLPEGFHDGNYRLEHEGKAVPAQFRPVVDRAGRQAVALDFNASPGPLEVQEYRVVLAGAAGAGDSGRRGMHVEREGGQLRVSNGSVLSFLLPENLRGFVSSAVNGKTEYLQAESQGLFLRTKAGAIRRVGGERTKATITREGPIAVGLRFEGLEDVGGSRPVRSTLEATFPNSKSWIEAAWEVDDPEGDVAALGLDLGLKVEGRPTLVDLGAESTVYAALRGREVIELQGGAPSGNLIHWTVRKGLPGAHSTIAQSPQPAHSSGEGWAHVMDTTRCTAVAVEGFGRGSLDRIEVDGQGRLRLWREFAAAGQAPANGSRVLKFWLHFVPMPVQVGAATSPQAMLAKLDVSVRVP